MTIAHVTSLDLDTDHDAERDAAHDRPEGPIMNAPIPGQHGATLSNAVVGRLAHGRRLVDTIAFLAANGIDACRVHVLRGPEGEMFLARVGNRFSRLFAGDKDHYFDLLRNGATLVAVLDVHPADQDGTAQLLRHAGVRVLRRYGSWTVVDG